MKAVRPVIASNGVPYLQMRSVGSHSTSGRARVSNGLHTLRTHVMCESNLFLLC